MNVALQEAPCARMLTVNYLLGPLLFSHHTEEVLYFLPHDSKMIEVEPDGTLPPRFSSQAINKSPSFGSFSARCFAFLLSVDFSV